MSLLDVLGRPRDLVRYLKSKGLYRRRSIFLLYILAALAALFPSWIFFLGRVPGSPFTDTYQHIWTLWWPSEALSGRPCLPFHTNLLVYPEGGCLYPIDILNGLALVPLIVASFPLSLFIPVMPPLYYLVVVGNLALGAYGAFLLSCHLTRRKVPSILAGFIYGFSAYALSNVENGLTEGMSLAWVPLCILYLYKTFDNPTRANALAGGLFLFLALISNWYYATAVAFFIPFFFLYRLLTFRKAAVRGPRYREPHGHADSPAKTMPRPLAFLLLFGCGAALTLPFVLFFMRYVSDPSSIFTHAHGNQSLWSVHLSDLSYYVEPGRLSRNENFPYIHATYLGFVPLFLSFLTAGFLRRSGLLWLASGLFFFALSLGPYLRIHHGSQPLIAFGREWLLPFNYLATQVPLFSQMSFPYRLVMMSSLSLALMSALGLALVLGRARRRTQGIVTGILCALAFIEVLAFAPINWPVTTAPTPFMPALVRLGGFDTGGGIIDAPNYTNTVDMSGKVDDPNKPLRKYTWGIYFYGQTVHHRGIHYSIRDQLPYLWENNTFLSFMNHIETCIRNGSRHGNYVDRKHYIEPALAQLRDLDFRYVVVHDDLLRDGKPLHDFLEYFLGRPSISGNLRIYRMKQP